MKISHAVYPLFFGILGSFIFSTAHQILYQKSFAVIQMDKVLTSHIEQYAQRNISESKRLEETKLFSKILTRTLDDIQKREKVILLTKPAVVSNLKDYTTEVILRVDEVFKNDVK